MLDLAFQKSLWGRFPELVERKGARNESIFSPRLLTSGRLTKTVGKQKVCVPRPDFRWSWPQICHLGQAVPVLTDQAMELILTGVPATAAELERLGVVNRVVQGDGDVLMEATMEMAQTIASFSAPAIGLAKQAVLAGEFSCVISVIATGLTQTSRDDNLESRVGD